MKPSARALGEEGFTLFDIRADIKANGEFIQKRFDKKLALLYELIDLETRLTGIYFKGMSMKLMMHLVYNQNIVVNNALMTQPYFSYSILLLTTNTLYGSARVVERQFFEALVIAKFSEYSPELKKKWLSKTEDDRQFDINFTNDVMNKLHGKEISAIKNMWRELNNMTHHTRYAQQVFRPTNPLSETRRRDLEESRKGTNFEPDIHYTLDLLFMLLCMNFHLLISNWGRKSERWWFGYRQDPYGVWEREKEIKERIKRAMHEYFPLNNDFGDINKVLKKVIRQYKQSWVLQTTNQAK